MRSGDRRELRRLIADGAARGLPSCKAAACLREAAAASPPHTDSLRLLLEAGVPADSTNSVRAGPKRKPR